MAIKRVTAEMNVVQAAKLRIKNTFRNGLPVYMSFSGGKDSICLASLVEELLLAGEINPAQLTVQFIDEEAIFPCIEESTMQWRRRFMLLGVKFEWFCIEVKHFNCFNSLSEDETFICWDSEKQDCWVRQPPAFAIRQHPLLHNRIDAYQDFLPRLCTDGLTMTGVRAYESVQRLKNISASFAAGKTTTGTQRVLPIYDWRDSDVWLYLQERKASIPRIYLYLWQSGTRRNQLRVSQFFSIDTARSLVKMNEYYPNLMERVIRREPNAYLAALYWDSEMFGRTTRARKELEGAEPQKDYRAMLIDVFQHIDQHFVTDHQRKIANDYRTLFLRLSMIINDNECKQFYEALIRGDPKRRSYRALVQNIYTRYVADAKKGCV